MDKIVSLLYTVLQFTSGDLVIAFDLTGNLMLMLSLQNKQQFPYHP